MYINFDAKITRFGYRKAMAKNSVFSVDFKDGDGIDILRQELASVANANSDNHETYLIENKDGSKIVLTFTDWIMKVGTDILVERW